MPRPIDMLCPPDWNLESKGATTTVTRRSVFTRELNTMEIPTTYERSEAWLHGGTVIQNALPELNVDQREFLMSGATPEEWEAMFG